MSNVSNDWEIVEAFKNYYVAWNAAYKTRVARKEIQKRTCKCYKVQSNWSFYLA